MKTAYVLSGGGAAAVFQVGVLEQLGLSGLVPDALYGTSAGALNASGLAFAGIEALKQLWFDTRRLTDVVGFNTLGINRGLCNLGPTRKKIERFLTGSPSLFPCTVVVTDIASGEAVPIIVPPLGVDWVVASCSIPGVIEPQWIDGRCYVDGGVTDNTPLNQAIVDGAERIFVILSTPFKDKPDLWRVPTKCQSIHIGVHAINLMIRQKFIDDIDLCVARNYEWHEWQNSRRKIELHIYAPTVTKLSTLDFADPTLQYEVFHDGLIALPFSP